MIQIISAMRSFPDNGGVSAVLREKEPVVASIPVARKLSPYLLANWRQRVPPAVYSDGQVLFYKNHSPYGLYVIYSGAVELRAGERSRQHSIFADAGTILVPESVYRNEVNPYTAVIVGKSSVGFVGRSRLCEWVDKGESLIPEELRQACRTG